MIEKLHKKERELFDYMMERLGKDVPISDMHDTLYGAEEGGDARTRQQRVGAVVSRINVKVVGHHIAPGDLKQTYRLTAI